MKNMKVLHSISNKLLPHFADITQTLRTLTLREMDWTHGRMLNWDTADNSNSSRLVLHYYNIIHNVTIPYLEKNFGVEKISDIGKYKAICQLLCTKYFLELVSHTCSLFTNILPTYPPIGLD